MRWARGAVALLAAASLCPAQSYVDVVAEQARKVFQVPGIAVAIVKDGKVVVAKGYGVRRLGETAPVTADTLFGIASNTKAFTSAALAILVDEGKIAWDDPVVRHMPAFQMYDPWVTREITVRDLLVHRSGLGLGAGDLMFWPQTDLSRDEVLRRLRFIPPATSFRSKYAYDNILYLAAGQLVPAVTGVSWDDFVRDRIFRPLGMSRSNTAIRKNPADGDVATPHAFGDDGKLRAIAASEFDNNAPAGGINAPVSDLAKWMIVQLNHGAMEGGRRLFSAAQSREMWTPVVVMPSTSTSAVVRSNLEAYALGWRVSDYRGHRVVSHTGGLNGYVSRTTLLPDERLGVVVLTNQEERGAYDAVTWTVVDHYLGEPRQDWVTAFDASARQRGSTGSAAIAKASTSRNANSRPARELRWYAGRYRDAWYGDVYIEERDGGLEIRFSHSPGLTGKLEHWQYDTFIARWRNRTMDADAYVTFALRPDGAVDQVKMAPVSPNTDFSYDFQDLLLKPVPANAPKY